MAGIDRRDLDAAHERGEVLTASGWAPERENLRQTLSIHRECDGRARVYFETYEPTEYDTEVSTGERTFETLDLAFRWIHDERKLSWTGFRAHPRQPPLDLS